jgi:hypothetical protein
MLMLYPLLVILLVVLCLRWEEARQRAWAEHPDRPWNVAARMARENLEWYEANYRKLPQEKRED